MAATSRFVLFDSEATTSITTETNAAISGLGTPGYVQSASAAPDTVTITTGVADQLQANIDGNGYQQITLTSGTNLDSRMVAREIEFKLKQLAGSEFDHVNVDYINNKFRFTSSSLGTTSTVAVDNGGNDCLHLLGMASSQGGPLTVTTVNGAASSNNGAYTGQVTVSGEHRAQFSDIYTVMIGSQHPVSSGVVASGGNDYAGVAQVAGDWNESTTETYTVTISTTNGSVMNAGTGDVPTFTVTSTQGDNIASPQELLYADYWYEIGTKGLLLRFSDAPFGDGDIFSVTCSAIQFSHGSSTNGAVGVAEYVWSSRREGVSSSSTVTNTVGTAVGTRGVVIAWSASGNLTRRDEFRILASGPQPTTLGVTTLNYGSVTVSTYSEVKAVWFQLLSGALVLSNTKFGLQSNGTTSHHNEGASDTFFAFGTVGTGAPASDGTEWKRGIEGPTDLASDVPPSYLAATENNLSVVSTADASEEVGVVPGEMISDFIYLAIKLGAAETGANSTIVYRQFYDYS